MKKPISTKNRIAACAMRNFPFPAGIMLSLLAFPVISSAQITTIVRLPLTSQQSPSFKVKPVARDTLFISATGTTRDKTSFLQFNLSTIPSGATIASAALQLTLATDPSDRTSVIVHQVLTDNMDETMDTNFRQIASQTLLAEDDTANSIILFGNLPLDRLQQALAKKKFTIRISTTFRNGAAAFYSSANTTQQNMPAFIPRLAIAFTPEPARVTWGSWHADAQHTAMSPSLFRGTAPAAYTVKPVYHFTSNIQKNMLLYKDKVYIVAQDGASAYHLYSIDPVTKSLTGQISNLGAPVEMGAIDPFGRYYHITSQKIGVIDLEAGNAVTYPVDISGVTVKAPPTVGADGTLYLATSLYICAYAPYPRHDLLWRYKPATESMSGVALNHNGTTAYVVFGDPLQVVAINTVSGLRSGRLLLDNTQGAGKGGKMVPVINDQGQLFVADGFPSGKKMYVVNKSMAIDTVIPGKNISQPAVGGDGTVYYACNGNLMSYKNSIVRQVATGVEEVTSMITDNSNNIYCWSGGNRLMAFDKDGRKFMDINRPLADSSREWEMTMAPDGSLYTGTTKGLYAIRPSGFTPASYSFTREDTTLNNRTFRANTVIVPAGANFGDGYTTTITGTQNIVMENVLRKGASVQLLSGGTMVFKPGFKVETGARLSCKTGY